MRRSKRVRVWAFACTGALTVCVLVACSAPATRGDMRSDSPAVAVEGSSPLSATPHAVDALGIDRGELAWAGIRIGTPRHELERLLEASLEPLEPNEICASFVVNRAIGVHDVTLEFPDESATAPLEHLFIELHGDLPQVEQIERVKQRLPGSIYVPSRYAPDLVEDENPKPVYRVATVQPRVVMLHHNEGLWLGDPRCYD